MPVIESAHAVRQPRFTAGTGLRVDPPVVDTPPTLDSLIADCAEVTRQLAQVPHQRVVTIPDQAVAMVADLGSYGD